jgi:tRNA threonylcarbamoyladenosine biosynthesis protein TsaB
MGSATTDCLKGIFLGLDTSGLRTGLALVTRERTVYEINTDTGISHNESLLLLLEQAFAAARVSIAELSGIGLTIGPGMWTALRVGLSVVKGLVLPQSLPVKGVNTLSAVSATAARTRLPVLAVLDARRGEVYAALYRQEAVLIPPCAVEPAQLATRVAEYNPGAGVALAGDGSELVKPALAAAGVQFEDTGVRQASPAVVARLGMELLNRDGPDGLAELEPVYLRRTDAEINRERRGG